PARPMLVADGAGDARRAARPRWIGWKAAAAIALAAAGGGTMLFWNRADDPGTTSSAIAVAADGPDSSSPRTSLVPDAPTASTTAAAAVRPALNVAGGLTDLTDGDLQTLLDDMGSLGVDSPSFGEPEAVIPQLPGSEGTES
ncbi:MAG: hypothetical protein HOQ12_02120, partial [Gemmatimonadaceae bacterium]|nr:hypothetical protein [Gemmatimonadaceae bacterium]